MPPKRERIDHTETLPPGYRRLDTIARLITGAETCAAVCFDGEKFLVTNNTGMDTELRQRCFDFFHEIVQGEYSLSRLQESEFQERMDILVESSIAEWERTPIVAITRERIANLEGILDETITDSRPIIQRELEIMNEAIRVTGETLERAEKEIPRKGRKVQSIRQRKRTLEQLQEQLQDPATQDTTIEQILSGLQGRFLTADQLKTRWGDDIRKVAISLAKDNQGPDAFTPEMKEAIRGQQVEFINDTPGLHAEMRILERLIDGEGRLVIPDQEVMEGRRPLYIGLTKLCCADCHDVIEAFDIVSPRSTVTEVVDEQAAPVYVRGTHQRPYPWTEPPFLDRVPGLRDKLLGLRKARNKNGVIYGREAPNTSGSSPDYSDGDRVVRKRRRTVSLPSSVSPDASLPSSVLPMPFLFSGEASIVRPPAHFSEGRRSPSRDIGR